MSFIRWGIRNVSLYSRPHSCRVRKTSRELLSIQKSFSYMYNEGKTGATPFSSLIIMSWAWDQITLGNRKWTWSSSMYWNPNTKTNSCICVLNIFVLDKNFCNLLEWVRNSTKSRGDLTASFLKKKIDMKPGTRTNWVSLGFRSSDLDWDWMAAVNVSISAPTT